MLTPQQERELIYSLATPVLALYAPVWSRSASQADVEKFIDDPPALTTSTAGPFSSDADSELVWVKVILYVADLVVQSIAGWAAGKLLDPRWQQVRDRWTNRGQNTENTASGPSPILSDQKAESIRSKVVSQIVAEGVYSEDAVTEIVNEVLKLLTK
jgi:hypothetical protein